MSSLTISRLKNLASWTLAAAALVTAAPSTQGKLILNQVEFALPAGESADPQQGVYVRDSAIAADKFELGKRMERLKEWPKSADVYQEILEKYQDRVVPTLVNEKSQSVKYASVTVAVQERLARWPLEGLTVYRARFEPVAATLLEQARRDDLAALHKIFSFYFATDTAKVAGQRLMDLYIETGEFSAASWIGDRLLDLHPNLAAERAGVLFRTALAYHLAGNAAVAAKRAGVLKANYPNELALIAGKDTKLVQAIESQLREKPPVAIGGSGDSWMSSLGGDASRSLVISASAKPGARIYKIDLPGPNLTGLNPVMRQNQLTQYDAAQKNGQAIGVIPAVDRGEMFFQDGQRIFAIHVESGAPLAGWTQTYSGQRAGQFWLPMRPIYTLNQAETGYISRQHTITLTDDSVLAVMGQPDARAVRVGLASRDAGTRLVCLDRATGRPRWIANPDEIPKNDGNAKNLAFSGSPLVAGDNVYAIARGSTGAGVEDCHLCCYELASGKFKWKCYIASSQNGGIDMNGMPSAVHSSETLSHAAFASGRIFVLTNLGALAAIDAYSGATAWLTIYPRDESIAMARTRQAGRFGWNGNPAVTATQDLARPWEFNPVIVQDGKVFTLPNDGRHLLIYDAATGDEIKRINRNIAYNDTSTRLTMLLAVVGEKLIVAGRNKDFIFGLNWQTYAQKNPDDNSLDIGSTFWTAEINEITGRPFVTQDSVFVPCKTALRVLSMALGRVIHAVPPSPASWPDDEGRGNVVVTRDRVILAGAKYVSVYTDIQGVRQKYQTALKADPANVEARLIFAELMFNARELDESRKTLDEAVQVLGGLSALRPGPLRDRVFSDALLFAQKLGAEKNEASVALAEQFFDRAAAAALNPSQQVNYRLSRARFIEGLSDHQDKLDYSRAVALYQQILSTPPMRILSITGDDGSAPVQAGKVAEVAINELIRRFGPSVYESLEKEAAVRFAALGNQGNPDQLLALADNYPNSQIAPQAMQAAAQSYEKTKQPRMATQVLRRLYWKYSPRLTAAQRAQLTEAMARNYLRVGATAAALGRLQKATALFPETRLTGPLLTPDGKPLQTREGKPAQTFQEAADVLQKLARQTTAAILPDARLPLVPTIEEQLAGKERPKPFLPESPQSTLANIQALIEPPSELADRGRIDRVLAWSDGKLVCYPAGKTVPFWSTAAPISAVVGSAWLESKLLVWSEAELAVLDPDKGALLWKSDLGSLPAAEMISGGAAETAPAAAQPRDPFVFELEERRARNLVMQQRGLRINRIVVDAPAEVAPAAPPVVAAADGRERILHVRPLSDRLIISTSTGRVFAADLADGHTLWQTRLAAGPSIQQTVAGDDFAVVRLHDSNGVNLIVLDSFNGQQIFRKSFTTNQATYPINCALAADGTLVWTTPQSMAAKDLYDAGEQVTWESTGRTYTDMVRSDQLVIVGQEILAVCERGVYVDRRSLRTGHDAGSQISTGTNNDSSVRLYLNGPRLYIISNRSVIAYHLEQGSPSWSDPIDPSVSPGVSLLPADLLLTRNHLFAPSQTTSADGQVASYTLRAYSRAIVLSDGTKALESGRREYDHLIKSPAKIKAWQAVEGGIYYLTADDKLHFLMGNKK
jgi:outer membrane protein assembly factor BamB/tetratricopeptide (TPR) repeat protein